MSLGFSPISIFLFATAVLLAYFFLGGFIWGAGYFPTPFRIIEEAGKMLELKEGMLVYDLGSGSGRVVIEFAGKFNVRCVGVEIDPFKSWWSRWLVRKSGLSARIKIWRKNFLGVNLSDADAIFLFLSGGTKVMAKLKKKIFSEVKPGTKVVSYSHKFEDWKTEAQSGELFLYRVLDTVLSNKMQVQV